MDLLERAVAALGIEDRTMIQSFDARPLRVLEERNSALRRAVLFVSDQAGIYGTILRGNPIETATFVGAQVVSPYGPITNRALIDAAHARGLVVFADVVHNHYGPTDLDLWRYDGWSVNDLGGIYFYCDERIHTPWGSTRPDFMAMGIGLVLVLFLLAGGAFYFRRMERIFADVI